MFTTSIDPIIFAIGQFAVRWYSLILLTVIGIGIWLTARKWKGRGFKLVGRDWNSFSSKETNYGAQPIS